MEPGQTCEGTFVGKTIGPWTDKATGEEKDLTRLHFTSDSGEKFIIFEDGGLRNALANAMIKDGDYIRLEKGKKTDLGGGRTVNSWDVFTVTQ